MIRGGACPRTVWLRRRRIPKLAGHLAERPELQACPAPRTRMGRTAQRDEQVISPAGSAITCTDFPSGRLAQGCIGPSESQKFQLSSRVGSEFSAAFKERASVHGCPSFVRLFLLHKGCISLARTEEGAERYSLLCLLVTQQG